MQPHTHARAHTQKHTHTHTHVLQMRRTHRALLLMLRRRPHTDHGQDGLEDDHVASCSRLTSLRTLTLRGSEDLSDAALLSLTGLTRMTSLSLLPLGLYVSREGVTRALEALPGLQSLSVGLQSSGQVAVLRDAEHLRGIRLVVDDPTMNQMSFFSECTLCLRTSLVSLR